MDGERCDGSDIAPDSTCCRADEFIPCPAPPCHNMVDISDEFVSFAAILSKTPICDGQTRMPFGNLTDKQGFDRNGFDAESGTFTATTPGVYIFTHRVARGLNIETQVVKRTASDEQEVMICMTESQESDVNENHDCTSATYLNTNDEIFATCSSTPLLNFAPQLGPQPAGVFEIELTSTFSGAKIDSTKFVVATRKNAPAENFENKPVPFPHVQVSRDLSLSDEGTFTAVDSGVYFIGLVLTSTRKYYF